MTNEEADKIINTAPEGWTVLAVAVPTRALRVIGDEVGLKFRVEQLDVTTIPWTWRVISTHQGDKHFESFGPAVGDLMKGQVKLREKVKLAQHEARMAQIKAANPLGGTVH